MSITIEQLQDRSEARNPAQWEWRLLNSSCYAAGNSPVLNTKFKREVINSSRSFRKVRTERIRARLRARRALQRSWEGTFRLDTSLPYLKIGAA